MDNYFQLKITLKDITPSVWRRFVVPADISLDRLHDIIQIVMGWEDSHLHQFEFKKQIFTEFPESPHDENEAFTRLSDLFKKKGNKLIYRYDFGDDWEHEILLEDKNYSPDDMPGPFECLDGEMICPMEDCGGPGGYMALVEVISDPKGNQEEFEALLEFIGVPDASAEEMREHLYTFDIDQVNSGLALYSRWSRDRMLTLISDE